MKIKVYMEPWSGRFGVLLYQEVNGKRYLVKPVELVLDEEKNGVVIEPTFFIAHGDVQEFLSEMAKAAEEQGIKTQKQLDEEGKAKYELGAIKYHLEDMRKLVFKDKNKSDR